MKGLSLAEYNGLARALTPQLEPLSESNRPAIESLLLAKRLRAEVIPTPGCRCGGCQTEVFFITDSGREAFLMWPFNRQDI